MRKYRILYLAAALLVLGLCLQGCKKQEKNEEYASYVGKSIDEVQKTLKLVQDTQAPMLYHTSQYVTVGDLKMEVILSAESEGGTCYGYQYLWHSDKPQDQDYKSIDSMYQSLLKTYGEPDSKEQSDSLFPYSKSLKDYAVSGEGQDIWNRVDDQSGLGVSVSLTQAETGTTVWIHYQSMEIS